MTARREKYDESAQLGGDVRVPGHDGQDSGLKADSIPE
jgi:hypothetical protein